MFFILCTKNHVCSSISVLQSAFTSSVLSWKVSKWHHCGFLETLTHKLKQFYKETQNQMFPDASFPSLCHLCWLLCENWRANRCFLLHFTCVIEKKCHLCRSSLLNYSHIDVSLFFFSLLLSALCHKAFPCTLCTAFSLFFICFLKILFPLSFPFYFCKNRMITSRIQLMSNWIRMFFIITWLTLIYQYITSK